MLLNAISLAFCCIQVRTAAGASAVQLLYIVQEQLLRCLMHVCADSIVQLQHCA